MMAACACAFTSCDDWTDPEHIDLDYGTIDTSDPAAYEKYLANLREYRQRPHKQVYAWFNNAETAFGSQGHRVSSLPDSIDVIVINNPEKVTDQMVQEMYQARVNKGQQFSFCVSFDALRADWTALCEQLAAERVKFAAENGEDTPIPAELQDPTLVDYIAKNAPVKLSYFNSIGFDCIMAQFDGKSTIHMTTEELNEYNRQSNAFLSIIEDWSARHPEVKVDLYCKPQNVTSNLLAKVRYAFVSSSASATNMNQYSLFMQETNGALPEAQCGMVASVPDYSGADAKTGYYSNGSLAVTGLAEWTAANSVGVAGILNADYDYFLTTGQFTNIRQFIQTVNPSAK